VQKAILTLALVTLFGCATPPQECPEAVDASQSFVLPDRGVQPPARGNTGLKGAWVVFKYVFWGQGRYEELPWWE
jgi:hypothetical protein